MIELKAHDIRIMEERRRAQLINSVLGFKPALLLGSVNNQGQTNLALMSSVVHLGANPSLIGVVFRPHSVPRHSLENILETGFFTLNQVNESIMAQAHQTSARYPQDQSEFAATGLTEYYSEGLSAPYVAESQVKIGLAFRQQMPVELNGTSLVIGEIMEIHLPEEAWEESGYLDSEVLGALCVSGLDSYHRTIRVARLPYAKVENRSD